MKKFMMIGVALVSMVFGGCGAMDQVRSKFGDDGATARVAMDDQAEATYGYLRAEIASYNKAAKDANPEAPQIELDAFMPRADSEFVDRIPLEGDTKTPSQSETHSSWTASVTKRANPNDLAAYDLQTQAMRTMLTRYEGEAFILEDFAAFMDKGGSGMNTAKAAEGAAWARGWAQKIRERAAQNRQALDGNGTLVSVLDPRKAGALATAKPATSGGTIDKNDVHNATAATRAINAGDPDAAAYKFRKIVK